MECKGLRFPSLPDKEIVLIETSWNVKQLEWFIKMGLYKRINRNIVECKVQICSFTKYANLVLIETSWNVKTCAADSAVKFAIVLIETSWNVK